MLASSADVVLCQRSVLAGRRSGHSNCVPKAPSKLAGKHVLVAEADSERLFGNAGELHGRGVLQDATCPQGHLRSRSVEPRVPVTFVATSRNDGHGGDLLGRMQKFVDYLDAQCRSHDLDAELVLVEWNPPADRPSLADALRWPEGGGPLSASIVTVPASLHDQLDNASSLPLFQMIAKNVGIRRSRGRFVMATNIDVVFSDGAFSALAGPLREGRVYRADRHDVEPHPPDGATLREALAVCASNTVRMNRRNGTYLVREGVFLPVYQSFHELLFAWSRRQARRVARAPATALRHAAALVRRRRPHAPRSWHRGTRVLRAPARPLSYRASRKTHGKKDSPSWRIRARTWTRRLGQALSSVPSHAGRAAGRARKLLVALAASPVYAWRELRQAWADTHQLPHLHTNGCGDMTLMSASDWHRLRGYPEWPIFSWHLDSVLLHQAVANGMREVCLPPYAPVYHLEHAKGSGFTPEGETLLFHRLDAAGVPYLTSTDFSSIAISLHRQARRGSRRGRRQALVWNAPSWGMADLDLPAVTVVRGRWESEPAELSRRLGGGAAASA